MNLQKNRTRLINATYWVLCVVSLFVLITLLSNQRSIAREIVVVQSLDLSGQSNIGKDFSNGIRTYFDAVNAKGGVRGRKINFVQLDDSGDAKQTISNLKQLIRENSADVVIAPTTGASYLEASAYPELRASSLTLLGAPTGARPAPNNAARTLTIRASYADEARQLLSHLSTMRISSIALVRGEGAESEFAVGAFREEAKRQSRVLSFDGDTKQWQARTQANQSIEAVVIAGDAIAAAAPLAHAKKTAKNASLFGFSTIDHRVLLEISKDKAIGMVLSQAMPSADKTVYPFQREHRALMKQFRDEPPSLHTLEGYVVARVLVAALETVNGEPNATNVSAALRNGRDVEFGPMSVSTRIPETAMRFVSLSAVSKRGALID